MRPGWGSGQDWGSRPAMSGLWITHSRWAEPVASWLDTVTSRSISIGRWLMVLPRELAGMLELACCATFHSLDQRSRYLLYRSRPASTSLHQQPSCL